MTIASLLIDSLRRNDAGFTRLIMRHDDVPFFTTESNLPDGRLTTAIFEDFIQALQQNMTVTTVYVENYFVVSLSSQNLIQLFKYIGRLPKLEKLVIESQTSDCWELPIEALTNATSHTKGLVTLDLTYLRLSGDQKDFDTFSHGLAEISSLRELNLMFDLSDPTISVSPLFFSIASLPSLEKLVVLPSSALEEEPITLNVHPKCLEAVCKASSVKSLNLWCFSLTHEHITSMSTPLQDNCKMKSLVLCDCDIFDEGVSELSSMLRINSTLETLDLSRNKFGDDGCVTLCESLYSNTAVKELRIAGNLEIDEDGRGQHALEELQRRNYVLEMLALPHGGWEKNSFFLKLNRVGRRQLLKGELTRDQWVEAVNQASNDKESYSHEEDWELNCLFYFLRANPAIAAA